ncbi:MAG TPA: PKD domain-containing protein, partial [Candidatus Cloacimonadota bacterium]|nr:PKD domain-containing protein [Candidatus Cloacimonadota bacterium]
ADPQSGEVPLTVQFTDLSLPGIGNIVSWNWGFGDSAVSTLQNPQHTYTEPGVYTVSLQVTNSVGASYTLEKQDYITALAVGALVSYNPSSVSFMEVPYGQLTPPQSVIITNNGNATLNLTASQFKLAETPFSVTNLDTPLSISPGASREIQIRYFPNSFSTVSDSLLISNNSLNLPLGGIKLTGKAASQEPMPPQNIGITLQNQDVHLSWEPVTHTISGAPITTSYYAVFYNGSSNESGTFYYHGWTTDTSYIHARAAQYSPCFFYKVRAVTEYREESLREVLTATGREISEAQWLELIHNSLTTK